MFPQFNLSNFYQLCDTLGRRDKDLQAIIKTYGYPPFWSRPNTFESLVHIILEQQVSLASALSALKKLKEKVTEITPATVMLLSNVELRKCYFSRQKTAYVRALAEAIVSGSLSLKQLEIMDEESIRTQLTSIKGIGNWTADIYLVFILHHADVFPAGDLAAVKALKKVKKMSFLSTKVQLVQVAEGWRPYRTIAVMLLWHYYLEERKPVNKSSFTI